jgi:hypothetical protein
MSRCIVIERRPIRTGFLIAQLVLTVSTLTGCASQNLSDDPSTLTSNNAPRFRSKLTHAAKATANRPAAPSLDVRGANPVSPEHASNPTTGSLPDNANPTSLAQPGPAPETSLSAVSPDPRTLRAMNCRDLMLKERPTVRFGDAGSAAAQREYFDGCMRRAGNAP